MLAATKDFHELLESKGNEAKLTNILKCVRAQLKVPLIQGCIQYGYKTDGNTAYPGDYTSAARKGELWAFCSGVLPFLHEVNESDAEALQFADPTLRADLGIVREHKKLQRQQLSKKKSINLVELRYNHL